MTQNDLRQAMLAKRKALSADVCIEHGKALLNNILKYQPALLKPNQHIGIYLAANGEISLQPLIEYCWQNKIHCYAPVIQKTIVLQFAPLLANTQLMPNQFAILEPVFKPNDLINAEQLGIVFCPLVAFDQHGHRIGMGKGYYDKTFAFRKAHKTRPLLIGCAYGFQKVEVIEAQPWDVGLDKVATE